MASKRYPYLHSFIFVFIIFHHIAISHGASSLLEDENSLLKFKQSLKDDSNALLSWDPAKSTPCFGSKNNWVGIICSKGGNIWGLRLENMGLSGSIDIDALSEISRLRSLSFMNNSFSGPLPDFRKLRPLKALFLSNNKFDGSISPNAFQGMRRLRKLYLENNKFNGKIPISLVDLEKIVELNLEGNQFDGPIPDLKSSASLKTFNVSNNQLQGPIPSSLAKFDASAFSGNKELYGPPLTKSSPPPSTNNPNGPSMEAQTEDPSTSSEPESEISNKHVPIAAIAAGVSVAIILAILLIILVCKNNNCTQTNQDTNMSRSDNQWTAETPPHGSNRGFNENPSGGGGGGGGRKGESVGKLTFVREDYRPKFDLPDLLKAAAEILGSGCFGSSYKATFNDGNAVVVKRFKQMNNVGREEFQEHMRRLGRLNHPNLLPLLAYYYRKEEKLFITNPIQRGSLAVLLHGQTRGKPTLDWPTRLKVIKGVAKGLAYLYKELACLVAPHGHLKSSNVLINASYDALISDYGLIPLINQESVQEMMVAYKSPEHFNNGRITKKTDVWALGILIIEVLTGKFPSSYLQNGTEVDMTIWVRSVINEGFDKNMNSTRNCEGEMQKLLNIGMACCESNVDKRLDINQACDQIQELHDPDLEDDFYSTCDSTEPGSRNSSRPASHDFTVVIN